MGWQKILNDFSGAPKKIMNYLLLARQFPCVLQALTRVKVSRCEDVDLLPWFLQEVVKKKSPE